MVDRPWAEAERLSRRLQRLEYQDPVTRAVNIDSVSVDFGWPDENPRLNHRPMGNSVIIAGTGDVIHAVIRFPFFPRDEYSRDDVEPIARSVARAVGFDPDKSVRFNPNLRGIAAHVDYDGRGGLTVERVGEIYRTALETFRKEVQQI